MITLVFSPLLFAFICGIFLRDKNQNISAYLTTFGVFVAFSTSVFAFFKVLKEGAAQIIIAPFMQFEGFSSVWGVYIDGLTSVMLVVVTFVSMLVHLYSIGYMHDDENQPKFMAYLSLFTFFMIVLVTAKDFLQLFVGWEGVGLCSYLLIGFWNEKTSANNAAIKAFITNRVGDLALILGMCAIYYVFGTLEFSNIFANINNAFEVINICGFEVSYVTIIAVLLFIGAMGKSAQIFLHVWLPDAMEGPTPVSALIHAATMVTAGVFLLSRVSIFFEYSEFARTLVIVVGTITALFAATIALTQNDIKKIIAYSTCSQLGYMFAASGFSAYHAGVFHLATHAFFKALLFLSAGSIIHAMSGEQDINKMGGLRKKIPITFACIMIGSIAIAGIPPLSGFFSKDAILESAFMSGSLIGKISFYTLLLTAVMTTFYSWRLIILVFHGETNNTKSIIAKIHESPLVMIVPLILLAIFAIFAGATFEYIFHILSVENGIFANSIFVLKENNILEKIHETPIYVKFAPTVLSVFVILFAYWYFSKKRKNIVPKSIIKLVSNKYYFDEIYERIFIKPTKKVSTFLLSYFDKKIIDTFLAGSCTKIAYIFSGFNAKFQSGKINIYFSLIFISLVIMFFYIIINTLSFF